MLKLIIKQRCPPPPSSKHAFNGQKIVIINLAWSSEQHINYEIMETLKNGSFFSPKYNSRDKHAGIPHLVVFANFYPDKDKMSADRWDIRILHNVNVEKDLLDIHASEVYEPRQLPILKSWTAKTDQGFNLQPR